MKANGELEGMEKEAIAKGRELNFTTCVGCNAKRGTVAFVEMANVCLPCHFKAHAELDKEKQDVTK